MTALAFPALFAPAGMGAVDLPLDERSSLNLWSIAPDDLLAGSNQWRFDGTVILRTGYSRSGNKDGLHPGGSILDLECGMQDVFYRIRREDGVQLAD